MLSAYDGPPVELASVYGGLAAVEPFVGAAPLKNRVTLQPPPWVHTTRSPAVGVDPGVRASQTAAEYVVSVWMAGVLRRAVPVEEMME